MKDMAGLFNKKKIGIKVQNISTVEITFVLLSP